jgi:hypothetical protein
MIVVAARPTPDGFSYTIASAGGKPEATNYTWEAAEILREFGVEDVAGPIIEAQQCGAAILRDGLAIRPS